MDFNNNELKPILGRVRRQNKKKVSRGNKKCHTVPLIKRQSNKDVSIHFQENYMTQCNTNPKGIIEMRNEILERAKSIIFEDERFRDRLCDIDKWLLLQAMDPVAKSRDDILSLPTAISKIYNISNMDIVPRVYERDHVWLSMQWVIDGVDNPFGSRQCASTACLGKYICKLDGTYVNKPLPEMVPLGTLDTYRDYMSRGLTTLSFKEDIVAGRQDTLSLSFTYVLGKDVCDEPRCILCTMKDIYCLVTKPSTSKAEVTLKEYQFTLSNNFIGLSDKFTVDGSLLTCDFSLSESGVSFSVGKVPLVASIVGSIYQNNTNEIVIDNIYA